MRAFFRWLTVLSVVHLLPSIASAQIRIVLDTVHGTTMQDTSLNVRVIGDLKSVMPGKDSILLSFSSSSPAFQFGAGMAIVAGAPEYTATKRFSTVPDGMGSIGRVPLRTGLGLSDHADIIVKYADTVPVGNSLRLSGGRLIYTDLCFYFGRRAITARNYHIENARFLPSEDVVAANLVCFEAQRISVQLYTMNGGLLYNNTQVYPAGVTEVRIPVAGVAAGPVQLYVFVGSAVEITPVSIVR